MSKLLDTDHDPRSPRKKITDQMTYINTKEDVDPYGNGKTRVNNNMLRGPGGSYDERRGELMGKLNKLPNRGLKK